MKVLNSEQIRKADKKAIEEIGIPGVVLMENAGRNVVESIEDFIQPVFPLKAAIFCGKGNNGGDGFVIARHFFNKGHNPEVILLGSKEEVKGDALVNLDIIVKMGVEISEIKPSENWQSFMPELNMYDLIVDAIFGTGLSKPVEGFYADIIDFINLADVPVVAVDIPSGLSSDTGNLIGPAILADLTVTFAYPKLAHVLPPAEDWIGHLVVADIGMPPGAVDDKDVAANLIDEDMACSLLPVRESESHKGNYGHLLIVAGSVGKTGAASMTGEAALRAGAGLVTVGTPASLNPILETKLTEVMTEALAETNQHTVSEKALKRVLELTEGKDAIALGPGISQNEETQRFVRELVAQTELPLLIDADGINAFISCPQALRANERTIIITPHPGEIARLINTTAGDVQKDRLGICRHFAMEHNIIVVLKGYRTVISSPEGELFINSSGNPGMASGGTGDILTGMLGGLLVQGLPVLDALILGVYLHGLAGDIAAQELGMYSLAATDLLDYLPDAFRSLESPGEED